MTALLDALERARIDFDFAALAELLRSGYQPTDDDCDALAAFTLDHKRRATRQGVAAKARAVLHYKQLRSQKWSADDALAKTCAEFPMLHPASVQTAIRGRDISVNRLLADWAARTAYKKS